MKRYRSCDKRVTDSSQAVIWYIFLPTSFKSLHSLRPMRARDAAYFEWYTTNIFPVFRPVLSKGASKENIAWHLSMLL